MSKPKHGLKKGQILQLEIESIAGGGQAVAKYEGLAVFVEKAAPGDLIEAELFDLRKDFAFAKVKKLIRPSSLRQEAPCKLFNVCGGCQWQHLSYQGQLDLKEDMVRQALKRIGGLDHPGLVLPAIGAEFPLNYRNKVQYPVASPKNSTRILAGYYKEGSHELVNIKHCPVQPEALDSILESAKAAAENAGLTAYKEQDHGGLLRHINMRYSFAQKQALLTLVINAESQNYSGVLKEILQKFAAELSQKFPELIGICINYNSQKGNRIFGDTTELIYGSASIEEKLCSVHENAGERLRQGLNFKLSSTSFFQVNSAQAARLMDLVFDSIFQYKKASGLEKLHLIVDAYAGVATIAAWVSELAEKVIAIEEHEEATKDAAEILAANEIANVEMRQGSVEAVLPELLKEGRQVEVLILDPPRKGVDKDALVCAAALKPQLIIYVSCNPATLARDLKILQAGGYQTKHIQPIDLFPQTYHVECLAVLEPV